MANLMFYHTKQSVVGILCDWDSSLCETTEHPGEENPLEVDKDLYDAVKQLMGGPKPPAHTLWTYCPKFLTRFNTGTASPEEHDEEGIRQCEPRSLVGTGPFMAMESLNEEQPPAHLYRHDLESFFWVLVYFVVVHNPEKHTLGCIDYWTYPDLDRIRYNKAGFLMEFEIQFYILSRMHPQYESIRSTTLQKLAGLFGDMYVDNFKFINHRRKYVEAMVDRDRWAKKHWAAQMIALHKKRNDTIIYNTLMEYLT